MSEEFRKSCNAMAELIESCWDENNPNDGLTFDERLAAKAADLTGQDKEVLDKILGVN